MTNQARNSVFRSKAFLSPSRGRFGAVLGRNSSMSEPLEGASRFCLGARLRHGARALIFEFESLESSAGNQEVHGQPRMALEDAEQMTINGGGN
jgi:hypothetical protein